MPAELVPLGGLYSRGVVEATPWGRAQVAQDCIVDGGVLCGRPGYRNVKTSGSKVATPSSGVQGMWRFRPHPDVAVTICCIDGSIYWGQDPTTDTAQNGTWALVTGGSGVFAATAQVSGAQMDQYLYLGSDVLNASWRRVTWSGSVGSPAFTLQEISAVPAPTVALQAETNTSPSWTLFKDLSYTVSAAPYPTAVLRTSLNATSLAGTDWRAVQGTTAPADASVGAFITFALASAADWRNDKWIVLGISPHDTGGSAGTVEVAVAADVSGSPGDFTVIGSICDTSPVWSGADGGGSPNHLYCSLASLPDSIRSAAKYIRLRISEGGASSKYHFLVYGFAVFSDKPISRPLRYWATLYNATTTSESVLSNECIVNPVRSVTPPNLPDLFCTNGGVQINSGQTLPTLPPALQRRCYNDDAGLERPKVADVGTDISLRVAWTATGMTGKRVRIWKLCTTGKRLAVDYTLTGTDAANLYVTLSDQSGQAALSAESYRGGGAPPATVAMAVKGRRIIALGASPAGAVVSDQHSNRVYISSYVPPNDTTDPYPQFPALPTDDSDGWQMDFGSRADCGQAVIVGDAVYILTSEAVYSMAILAQDQVPQLVLARGCRGRGAAVYAEDMLVWASHDGIYTARGRSQWQELSADVRAYYRDTFKADRTTILTYRDRQLMVMRSATTNEKVMRYRMDEELWTTGTFAHAIGAAACWSEHSGSTQQAWLLATDGRVVRLQDTATGYDDDVVIPLWSYRTGWSRTADLVRVRSIVADTTDQLSVATINYAGHTVATLSIAAPVTGEEVIKPGVAGSRAYKWALGLSGAAATVVRSLLWERE